MLIAPVTEEFPLSALEGLGSRYRWLLKLSVEFRDELRRRLIINEPQGGECTPGSSFNGHPRQPQRRPIIPCSGLAGTESQEFQRVFAETQTPHRLFQVVHGEFVVE